MVDDKGFINVLNESIYVNKDRCCEYVWSTINTKEQTLTIYYRADEKASRDVVKTIALYEQKKLNAKDLAVLTVIFGKDHVFDFSGVNEYTSTIDNYYEASHYRPHVSKAILERIYR